MRRRRRSASFHEPSLVPLADMLCNTVGIMLMILIFTVLATGGALVPKRLPMEQETKATSLLFLCAADRRLLPVNDDVQKRFTHQLKGPQSFGEIEGWLAAFRTRKAEDEYFSVTAHGDVRYLELGFSRQASLDIAMRFEPKPGRGDTSGDLSAGTAHFLQVLAANDPATRFVFFVVKPDCVNVFTTARQLAAARSYRTGWAPHATDQPLLLSLTGDGGTPVPQ